MQEGSRKLGAHGSGPGLSLSDAALFLLLRHISILRTRGSIAFARVSVCRQRHGMHSLERVIWPMLVVLLHVALFVAAKGWRGRVRVRKDEMRGRFRLVGQSFVHFPGEQKIQSRFLQNITLFSLNSQVNINKQKQIRSFWHGISRSLFYDLFDVGSILQATKGVGCDRPW